MIVSRRADGLALVRQVDHQEQCAAMARAWGNDEFSRLPHWDDIEAAAALHDEGWRRWEIEHPPGGEKAPLDFVDLPREVHVELYRDGIAAAHAHSVRAGLLVSMHGSGLYERRFGLGGSAPDRAEQPPVVRSFLNEQERERAAILDRLDPDARAWAWAAYRLLQAWDSLSLYLVWRALPSGREGEMLAVPRNVADGAGTRLVVTPQGELGCGVDPWPFDHDPVALPVQEWKGIDAPDGPIEVKQEYFAQSQIST